MVHWPDTADDTAPPPLRFDAPSRVGDLDEERTADGVSEHDAYRQPRDGFFRTYRVPLLLAMVWASLIAAVWVAWTPALEGIEDGARALAKRDGDGQTQVSVTVALGAVALLGFVVAWGRATHPRRAVRLSRGRGRMAVDDVAGRLRDAILELRAVREAEVNVENRGRRGLLVHVWMRLAADARIDDTLDQVDAAADWVVHDRLGLLLAEPPLVDVKYDELDLRAARAHLPQRDTRRERDEDA